MQSWLIVLLVMIAAGGLVCCGYAVYTIFLPDDEESGIKPPSVEQSRYMAEARLRNLRSLAQDCGLPGGYLSTRGYADENKVV
ncbi:hypothetical protein IQ07DRAFT_586680 [Pyrenochaeta sp. DS3sAY3a]|nr:hypothetical protein IQ07DRAFT_586680 [Pyrenochaeta sp. DS3sAY3a]